jgi:acyl carrier protein
MNNVEKLNKAFLNTFNIEESKLLNLKYQSIPTWDSVGHMNLIANLEELFDIMMETDDIIDFSSYEKGKIILNEKYNIDFQ